MESNQLIHQEKANYSLKEIKEMAEYVASSGLFEGIKTVEAAVTLMMLCQAENLHPIKATQRYHIIKGRPSMKADSMLGEFQARGGKVKWTSWDDEKCEAVFFAPGIVDGVTVDWTFERAQRANLTNSTAWKSYPRNMLRARVISDGIRMCMPSIIAGIYTSEEASDMPVNEEFYRKSNQQEYNKTLYPTSDPDVYTNFSHEEKENEINAFNNEIKLCETIEELYMVGENIKNCRLPASILREIRKYYAEKLNQLKEKQNEVRSDD